MVRGKGEFQTLSSTFMLISSVWRATSRAASAVRPMSALASYATSQRKPYKQLSAGLCCMSSSASALATREPSREETPTLAPVQPEDLPIVSVQENKVAVGWDPRTWSRFHSIWLRDHCRCEKCFHGVTKQRLVNTFEIPPDITPLQAHSTEEGLEISWPSTEPHISLYPWSFLQTNSYDPPLNTGTARAEKILWGAGIDKAPPTVSYGEVMDGDEGVYRWLVNVEKFGFCFVSGVPATTEATDALARRIAFIRETQYGTFWDFTADLSKGDTAYTNMALNAHTDNTYFTDPCGLQLFHLLSHTGDTPHLPAVGGATLLVDGFYVASLLKTLEPEMYELLSSVQVPAHAAGEPESIYQATGFPVLSHTKDGRLSQVRWNNDDRSALNSIDPDLVEDWYAAIRMWNKLLKSADSEYWVQLQPGTAVVMDNHRVLHGRSRFEGSRRMCGAYIGGDEYRSRLGVLRERYGATDDAPRSIWHPAL